MVSTRIRLSPPRWLPLAVLGLAAFGCQSNGSSGADEERDEGTEQPRVAAPDSNTVVSVRERDTDAKSSESRDEPARDAPVENESAESVPEPTSGAAAAQAEATLAPASAFAACISDGGAYSDCETVFVTVAQEAPERCIQLTIDNCGTYGRQGLSGADTPFEWRLAGGTVTSSASPCELGVFYAGSSSFTSATGSIAWDEAAPRPTDITFDLTLELLTGDETSIALATSEPLQPSECEE